MRSSVVTSVTAQQTVELSTWHEVPDEGAGQSETASPEGLQK